MCYTVSMTVAEEKKKIREKIKVALAAIPDRQRRTDAITRRVFSYVKGNGFTSVALYLSAGNELSTKTLVEELLRQNVTLSVPVVTGEGEMVFSQIKGDTEFRKGAFGISEPINIVPTSTFDVMFVPLVAFDKKGNRLGHGKGYYDRYFAKGISPNMKKIGLAFAEQEVPSVPCERTDVKLDGVFFE